MDKFIKSNALISLVANLVINSVIPFFILRNDTVIYLKQGSPILLETILPAVFISAFATCLITFFLMTKKRKSGEINLPIMPNTQWFPKAIFEGIVISLVLGVIAFGIMKLIENSMENVSIPVKITLIISSITGGLTGFITAFIAANRASKI